MAKFDYGNSAKTAQRLIDRFGFDTVLTRIVASGEKWNPQRQEVEYQCSIAVMNYSNADIDGTLIKTTDKKAYIAANISVTPKTTDLITIDGVKHAIVNVITLKPATTTVYYSVQLRA